LKPDVPSVASTATISSGIGTQPSSQRIIFKLSHRKTYTEHIGIATEPTEFLKRTSAGKSLINPNIKEMKKREYKVGLNISELEFQLKREKFEVDYSRRGYPDYIILKDGRSRALLR
jgi:hypothetical protein